MRLFCGLVGKFWIEFFSRPWHHRSTGKNKSPSISRKGLFFMELVMGLEPATG